VKTLTHTRDVSAVQPLQEGDLDCQQVSVRDLGVLGNNVEPISHPPWYATDGASSAAPSRCGSEEEYTSKKGGASSMFNHEKVTAEQESAQRKAMLSV